MMQRCYNPLNSNYSYYGARGIKVCERWRGKNGARNFLADMGEREKGMSLDRVLNDGIYESSNCKWSTAKEQIHNRRPSSEWKTTKEMHNETTR